MPDVTYQILRHESQEAFSTDDGYLPQMKADALDDLKDSLRHVAKQGAVASELLAML